MFYDPEIRESAKTAWRRLTGVARRLSRSSSSAEAEPASPSSKSFTQATTQAGTEMVSMSSANEQHEEVEGQSTVTTPRVEDDDVEQEPTID